MASYCFMSTEKIKTIGTLSRKMTHNYRLANISNADPSRLSLNKELVKLEGESYKSVFEEKMQKANHTPRKNAVLGVEIMMTYNVREVDEDFDLEKWQEENIKWLQNTFGKENVISAVFHGDEGIPAENGRIGSGHIHAMVIPMVDGKLNCKKFLDGPGKMRQLQDEYGKSMEPLGLKRGMQGSVAKHEDIRKFYDALNKEIEKELPQIEKKESARDYRERANEYYKQVNLKHLDEKNKMKREMLEIKTNAKKVSLDEILLYETNVATLKKEQEELQKQKALLLKEKEVLNKIAEGNKEELLKLKNFDLITKGLSNYPDREVAAKIGENINLITKWQDEYEKELKSAQGSSSKGMKSDR